MARCSMTTVHARACAARNIISTLDSGRASCTVFDIVISLPMPFSVGSTLLQDYQPSIYNSTSIINDRPDTVVMLNFH